MKSAKKLPNSATRVGIVVAMLLLAVLLFCGCAGTVTPVQVQAAAASFDGTNQDSGFIAWAPGGGIITAHARDRYNGLIDLYGRRFIPPLTRDAGITATATNTFIIDGQHLVNFATMNRWHKEGKPSSP